MSDAVRKLLPALAALTDAEKAEVRALLGAGDEAGEPGLTQAEWEDAWDEECARRMEAVERGEMDLIPAEEVFRRTREKYG